MAYEKQEWVDHIVDDEGNVQQQGTLMDSVHFLHMEEGIYEANVHIEDLSNPHKVTPAQLGFGAILCYDEDGYLCVKDVSGDTTVVTYDTGVVLYIGSDGLMHYKYVTANEEE